MASRFILRLADRGGDIRHVLLGGRIVGSIVFSRFAPREAWDWYVNAIVSDPPGASPNSGTAETLADALVAWRAAWEAIEAGPHHRVGAPEGASKSRISGS
jgi:hypothetical protein